MNSQYARDIVIVIEKELEEMQKKIEKKFYDESVHRIKEDIYSQITQAIEEILWKVDKVAGDTIKELIIDGIEKWTPLKFTYGFGGYDDDEHPYHGKRLLFSLED